MWKFNDRAPLHVQLQDEIISRIIKGVYPQGEYIPSVRELAQEASVNPNTMQRALVELESTGVLISNKTVGRCVTEDSALIAALKLKRARRAAREFVKTFADIGIDVSEAIKLIKEEENSNE